MQTFLEDLLLTRALLLALRSRSISRWALRIADDELGKLSGLMTRGMFFSPRCRALAMASEMMRLAFSCLSSVASISCCCSSAACWDEWGGGGGRADPLRWLFFSDEELEDEDEDDEDDEEEDELLFSGGLTTCWLLLGPLAFLRG